MKIMLQKVGNTLVPATDLDAEDFEKIKAGTPVFCELKQPRNSRFHAKFFVLVNLLFKNQERYSDKEELREDLTIASGHYKVRYDLDGVETRKAKSISFANMDNTEFEAVYNDVVDTICKHFHFDKQELIDEVLRHF
jgi:hypothetical protein